jgi:hypothetical protein
MLRRLRPPRRPNNLQLALEWSEVFEAGRLRDPSLTDGTLEPGERFAVRIGPVKQVTFAATITCDVASTGATGTLVATDRRVLLLDGTAIIGQWVWKTGVKRVSQLISGRGVLWSASAERDAAGVLPLEGLVDPAYTSFRDRVSRAEMRVGELEFMKVQIAWRASQPGGLTAWREDFRAKYAEVLTG